MNTDKQCHIGAGVMNNPMSGSTRRRQRNEQPDEKRRAGDGAMNSLTSNAAPETAQ